MNKRWTLAGISLMVVGLLLAGTMVVSAEGPMGNLGRGGLVDRLQMMGRMGYMGIKGANSEAIAEALGLTVDELRAQLRDGATLADLAEQKGVELQALRDIAEGQKKANLLERLGQALENGRVTEAFSNWFKKGVDEGYVLDFDGRRIDNPTIQAAAKALNMTAEEVELQMWGGRTLADLAEKAGVELTAVQEALTAAQQEAAIARINEMVEDGRITRAQADWMIEGVKSGFQGLSRFGGRSFGRGEIPALRGDMPMMGGRDGRMAPGMMGRGAWGQGQNGTQAGSPDCNCTQTTPTN